MDDKRIGLGVSLGAAALALGLGVATGRTLEHTLTETERAPMTTSLASAAAAPKRYQVPVSDSQPATGAKDALVTIVEWCDLPDAACAALEPSIRDVLAKNPETVRLVFRHYPRAERAGSMLAHEFARAAHQQAGKFWEARALLLEQKSDFTLEDAERYSAKLGLHWNDVRSGLDEHLFMTAISADRVFAGMFDAKDAPALFVNGRALGENPAPGALAALVHEELGRAVELIASGVEKADVYTELTKHGAWTKPQIALNGNH